MALNAAQSGWGAPGAAGETFEKIAIPAARRKGMGILAMKVTGRNALTGKAPMEKFIRYVLSLPITAATISMSTLEIIEENARIAKAFAPLPAQEMESLARSLSAAHKASLDAYLADHIDE